MDRYRYRWYGQTLRSVGKLIAIKKSRLPWARFIRNDHDHDEDDEPELAMTMLDNDVQDLCLCLSNAAQ